MLTKLDLLQIQQVVQKGTTHIIQKELTPIKEDIGSLKKDVKSLKKDTRYVKKTVNVMVSFFNKEDVQLQKRVRTIEEHLALSP